MDRKQDILNVQKRHALAMCEKCYSIRAIADRLKISKRKTFYQKMMELEKHLTHRLERAVV